MVVFIGDGEFEVTERGEEKEGLEIKSLFIFSNLINYLLILARFVLFI